MDEKNDDGFGFAVNSRRGVQTRSRAYILGPSCSLKTLN